MIVTGLSAANVATATEIAMGAEIETVTASDETGAGTDIVGKPTEIKN
jgi:hypothetical protein